MCKECGCGLGGGDVKIGGHSHEHGHDHGHDHAHGHDHHHEHGHSHGGKTLSLNLSLMEKNNRLAERNRGFFRAKKLLVLNVVSSPGSGKTTFIRETAAQTRGPVARRRDCRRPRDGQRRRAAAHRRDSRRANHHRHSLSSGRGHGCQGRRANGFGQARRAGD